jgi:hypothetical protein
MMPADNPTAPISDGKQISNPFSTGGGGMRFETQVQASFAVLMLATGFAPCLPCRPIRKIVLQAQWTKRKTDDLIVFTSHHDLSEERKLHVQIKHTLSFTEANTTFAEVIQAMWADFINAELFTRGKDALALVTGPLSATDIEDTRTILEWARHSASVDEFLTKVNKAKFSSNGKREKLKAFRHHVNAAAKDTVSDDEFFQFLRHFHLLGYDLDVRSGVMHALLHTIVARHAPDTAESVWARVVQEVQSANQNGGTLTVEFFPDDLRELFGPAVREAMPTIITSTLPPTSALAWNTPDFAPALVTMNLLGACDESHDADMAAVRALSRTDPADWLRGMREVLQFPDSPIALRGKVWTIKNREELWALLATRVFPEHLSLLHDTAGLVLTEPDPQFELDREQRFAAAVYGKALKHSHALRRGLSETLALLGSQAAPLKNCPVGDQGDLATAVTRKALHSADWVRWGSLNDLLPLWAEASPTAFLDAVEHALSSDPCPFDRLFAEEGGALGGRNYLTGLLWALELLAWEEQFLVRATVALGALAAHDPGGQWGNRPKNSLTMIFLPWLPQTLATEERQLVAIRTLLNEHPDVAWNLLLSLMPSETRMSHGTHKPRWRAAIPKEGVARPTVQGYQERVSKFAGLAVEVAAFDPKRLKALISHLDQLPDGIAALVVAQLESNDVTALPSSARFDLWQSLTLLAQKHRRHKDAKWARPSEWLDRIEAVAGKLVPPEPEIVHRGLFRKDRFSLYERSGDWAQQDKEIADRQRAAVEEILTAQGLDGVLSFARQVESPYPVGFALGMIGDVPNREQLLRDLLKHEMPPMSQVADGFVSGNYARGRWGWVDGINFDAWAVDEIASLFTRLPFDVDSWQRANRLLASEVGRYWTRVPVNPYHVQGDIYVAVDALMKVNRPRAALDCLARIVSDKKEIDRTRAVQVLLAAVSSKEPMNALDPYDAGVVITALQHDPQVEVKSLIAIEWAYLPILNENNNAAPKTLDRMLATDADFFCEIIRMIFRSRNEKKDGAERSTADEPGAQKSGILNRAKAWFAKVFQSIPDVDEAPLPEDAEDRSAKARNAYEMLQQWHAVPGTNSGGELSRDQLMGWLDKVKQSTQRSGHFVIAMQQAGEVFQHAPVDPEGLWMHRAAAEALNRPDMNELRKGYSIGVYNARGVHWVDPTGTPEKELAATWAQRATEIENAGFHRFAATLRGMSERYSREAQVIIKEAQDEEHGAG